MNFHDMGRTFFKKLSGYAYFCCKAEHYATMTIALARHTPEVTETPWERLRRLIDLRRARLDLTLAGVNAVGGPSPKWVHKLATMQGPPTPRMRASMHDLDRALQWPDGTAWSLVQDDRSGWKQELLDDEERALLEVHDEADNFAFVVAARLRAIPEADRYRVMREVLALLDIQQ